MSEINILNCIVGEIEDLLRSNADVLLNCIADDLRSILPLEAMVGSENQVIDIVRFLDIQIFFMTVSDWLLCVNTDNL